MISIKVVAADQSEQTISGKPGHSLMKAAVDAGIDGIAADCGGSLTCATCHVYVDAPWLDRLPAPVPDETDMMDFAAAPVQADSRLSCQIVLTPELDGMVVRLPTSQY